MEVTLITGGKLGDTSGDAWLYRHDYILRCFNNRGKLSLSFIQADMNNIDIILISTS